MIEFEYGPRVRALQELADKFCSHREAPEVRADSSLTGFQVAAAVAALDPDWLQVAGKELQAKEVGIIQLTLMIMGDDTPLATKHSLMSLAIARQLIERARELGAKLPQGLVREAGAVLVKAPGSRLSVATFIRGAERLGRAGTVGLLQPFPGGSASHSGDAQAPKAMW